MSADATTMLEAEINHTRRVCELLERQREALLARDLTRIERVTGALEAEFEGLASVAAERAGAMARTPLADTVAGRLLGEVRAAQSRLCMLLELNQAIIGDRLAYVSAVLGHIHPDLDAGAYCGYAPPGRRGPGRRAVSRSA